MSMMYSIVILDHGRITSLYVFVNCCTGAKMNHCGLLTAKKEPGTELLENTNTEIYDFQQNLFFVLM